MTYWDKFEKLCSSMGKKPNPVGKEIGVSSATVTKWKNGAVPNGEILLAVADYFNVSTDYLLDRTSDPTPAPRRRKKDIREHRYVPNVWLVKERIKKLCMEQCKSMSEITSEISLAMEDLNQWDETQGISSIAFDRIADYLGCSVDYILGYTDEPTEHFFKSGDIIGDNNSGNTGNVTIGSNLSDTPQMDKFTTEFLKRFEKLDFDDKLEIMNLTTQKLKEGT